MKSLIIHVYGRVQGVFFRACTKEKADELGIAGHVQNCEDGSVLIHCCGSTAAVDAFAEWCHHGPSRARVEKVEISPAEEKEYDKFTIIR